MIPIIGPLISLFTTGVARYAEHKKIKAEGKIAIEQAKVRRIQKLDTDDANWDRVMAESSNDSWKDEYWTIVLSIPAILAFFPSMVDDVLNGFEALEAMPDWYKAALGIAIGAAFGFRKLSQYMSGK